MIGSISLGIALVAGRNRVPRPATGKYGLADRFALGLIGHARPWQILLQRRLSAFDSSVQSGARRLRAPIPAKSIRYGQDHHPAASAFPARFRFPAQRTPR
jgi:hypothetical protein